MTFESAPCHRQGSAYAGFVPPRGRVDALSARLCRPLSLRRAGSLPDFPIDDGAASVRLDFATRALRPGLSSRPGSVPGCCGPARAAWASGRRPQPASDRQAPGLRLLAAMPRRRGTGRRQPSSSASYRARYRRSLRIRRSCDVPRSMGGERASVRTATAEATVAPTATPTHPLSTQPMDPAIRTANMAFTMVGSRLRGHHPLVRAARGRPGSRQMRQHCNVARADPAQGANERAERSARKGCLHEPSIARSPCIHPARAGIGHCPAWDRPRRHRL